MYSKISHKLTKQLIKLGTIETEDAEIYEYGLQLLIALFFTTLIIIMFSLITNSFIETLLYLLGFFGVRGICGGYHAKHHYSCFVTTMATYFLFLFSHHYFHSKPYLNYIIFFITIISSVLIVSFAPIEHPDNPMTKYRKKKNRLLSILFSVIICGILFVSLLTKPVLIYAFPYMIGVFLAALAILAAKIELNILKRKERKQ